MKKKKIQIQAVLETRRCLRLFDRWGEYFDTPLKDNLLPSHDQILTLIRKRTRSRNESRLGIIAARIFDGSPVIAYQIVEKTTIIDQRNQFGHEDETTEKTSALLSKRIFIFGEMISRSKAKSLLEWIRKQQKKERDAQKFGSQNINMSLWEAKGLAVNSDWALSEFLRQRRFTHAIKIGYSLIIPFDPKTMELNPMKE